MKKKKINDLKGKKLPLQDLAQKSWNSIHQRAGKAKSYEDVEICDEWYTFSIFYRWFAKNHEEGWVIDKDIIIEGNRIYSPETCLMVAPLLNSLFRRSSSKHGIKGVYFDKRTSKYYAQIRIDGKTKQSGSSLDINYAHQHYVELRKKRLIELLERFSDCTNSYAYERLVQAIQQYL
ncbi:MAG: hypothetical protein K0S95_733 [Pantoea eucrina]|jgi:hypothetical protein|nr:hypothetical protein [Pantoea eucrina]